MTIQPSTIGETFGRTWVESFAFGKPCITTKLGNLKNIIKQDYNSIVITPSVLGVIKGIKKAITLNANDYIKLSKNAKVTAENFKQSKIILK